MENVEILKKLPVKRAGKLHEAELNTSAFEFKPLPVSWFTLDGGGEYRGEDENLLKFLYLPSTTVKFDLNKSHKDDKFDLPKVIKLTENIDPLLHWVKDNSSARPEADFICYRNVFASLLKTPYEQNEHFLLCGVKLRGTIYLCEFTSQWKIRDEGRVVSDSFSALNTKHGLKFQQYVLTDTPGEAPDMSQPFIRDHQDTFVVLRASVGPHALLYASKNKAVADRETVLDLEAASLIDFKTYRNDNYKWFKLLDWWSSSVTGRVDRMIIGLRGEYGVMREVQTFDVPTLLRKTHEVLSASGGGRGRGGRGRSRGGRGGFRGDRDAGARASAVSEGSEVALHNRCFTFLHEFLTFVKDAMKDDTGPDVVFKFEWSPNAADFVHCKKLSGGASEPFRFIPEWYKEWLDAQK